jgi:hypothetical protein
MEVTLIQIAEAAHAFKRMHVPGYAQAELMIKTNPRIGRPMMKMVLKNQAPLLDSIQKEMIIQCKLNNLIPR